MKRTHIRAWVGAAAIAIAGGDALGATYYVRSSGSNGNSGTSPGAAWRTLAHAVDNVSAGDVIYVGAGTYDGQVTPSGDGTSGNPIVVIGDTGGAFTGDAGAVVIQHTTTVISMGNDDYWTFRNLTITNTTTNNDVVYASDCDGLVFENCTITGADDCLDLNDGSATLTDCTIGDCSDDGVAADDGTLTMTGCTVDDVGGNALQLRSGVALTIDACQILDGANGIYIEDAQGAITNTLVVNDNMTDGVFVDHNNADVQLVNCTIWGVNDDGLDVNNGSVLVRNVIFSDIGDNCMEGSGSDIDADTNVMWQYGGSRSSGFNSPNENSYDPQFTDEAGGDFSIDAASGAVDDGVDMSAYTSVDVAGGARPAGAGWDIGAYEYGSASYTPADVPYATDFESGVGEEWVDERETTDGPLTTYLGPYTDAGSPDESTAVYLNTTPGSAYLLTFDFFTIDDWEGDLSQSNGDSMEVFVGGVTHFSESFDQNANTNGQTYTGTPEVNSNIVYNSEPDAIYRSITVPFDATGTETEILFRAIVSATDESWGIDNVTVVEVPPVFVDVTDTVNFDVDTNASMSHNASAVLWADLDDDGDLDAVATGASAYVLGNNLGGDTFSASALGDFARGLAMLDADGDGDADFFNADISHMTLFENVSGSLVDRGAVGVDGPTNVEHAAAADVDADGDVDLVVMAENGNWIALNEGDGHGGFSPTGFEDSEDAGDGLNDAGDFGNGDNVSAGDVNNDGHLDFFYHYGSGKLFKSNADGTYTEDSAGISVYVHNDYKFGSAWGDYDNDGDMDLFAPDGRSGNAGTLWRNSSDGIAFTDVASGAGITSTLGMRAACWGDYDNDGDLDLYVTTDASGANLLYTSNGDGTFTLDDLGAGLTDDYMDAVFVDYDNDGDLDLALTRLDGDGETVLLQNQTDNDNFLKVRLVGAGSVNTLAIGARIEVYDPAGPTLLASREIGTARGYGGTEPLWAHFGGLDPATTYTVLVTWPGGAEQSVSIAPQDASTTIGATTIDQMVTITASTGVRVVRWREVAPND